jgi:hypothetical protein
VAAAIIAVFPAGRRVGIVRRQLDTLTDHSLLDRADEPIAFLADVLDELAASIQPGDRIAMTAVPWTAHLSSSRLLTGVVSRALLLGALVNDPLTKWSPLLVTPAAFDRLGQGALADYPAALIGPREQPWSARGRLWVCRAAWDLAGAALDHQPASGVIDGVIDTARLREEVSA